jgi:dienelactone hydrolase
VAAAAHSQPPTDSAYTEMFYPSGSLRIQAYLYKPHGEGPFPVVIYNHGSRAGRERHSVPFEYIGRLLTRAGYAVLVPERRGYGGSDGLTWSEEVGNDRGQRFIARLQAETDDVLAILDYLRTLPDTVGQPPSTEIGVPNMPSLKAKKLSKLPREKVLLEL